MKFLLRADASDEIGYGHVMRCISLAEKLMEEGHHPELFTQDLPKPIFDIYGHIMPVWNCEKDFIPKEQGSIVVLDSYSIRTDREDILKMHDHWWFIRKSLLEAKRARSKCQNVLYSDGGKCEEKKVSSISNGVTLKTCSFEEYPEALKWADIVIGGGGVSSLERAYCGIPSLIIRIADNQLRNIHYLTTRLAAIEIGKTDFESQSQWLSAFAHNPDFVAFMSKKAMNAVAADSYEAFWKQVKARFFQ